MFHVPNECRLIAGKLASDDSFGNNGVFNIPINEGVMLQCIASDGAKWEHVSVLVLDKDKKQYTPQWNVMCLVKDIFWDAEDCVVQYHPPKSEYVNCHEHVLHLWRPQAYDMMRPPSILVGIKQ